MSVYTFEKRLGAGIAGLVSEYGKQLWSTGKCRKDFVCQITGKNIPKGSVAYRPITNGYNRMHRISEDGMKKLENE
jgi:hypothetical protein